jgi:hypothetical protein
VVSLGTLLLAQIAIFGVLPDLSADASQSKDLRLKIESSVDPSKDGTLFETVRIDEHIPATGSVGPDLVGAVYFALVIDNCEDDPSDTDRIDGKKRGISVTIDDSWSSYRDFNVIIRDDSHEVRVLVLASENLDTSNGRRVADIQCIMDATDSVTVSQTFKEIQIAKYDPSNPQNAIPVQMIGESPNPQAHEGKPKLTALSPEMKKVKDANEILNQKRLNKEIDIPIAISWPDLNNKTLVVGVDIGSATLPNEVYKEQLAVELGDDVSIRVVSGYFETLQCNSQIGECNPLIGGIKVQSSLLNAVGTLTLSDSDSTGSRGFIMSSHVADVQGGRTGQNIAQPTLSTRLVGTVITNPDPFPQRLSDSAFVQVNSSITTNETMIYGDFIVIGKKTSKQTPSPPNDTPVGMVGISTVQSTGFILGTGIMVQNSQTGNRLLDQVVVNFEAQPGDSGGPVISNDGGNEVFFYGTLVGRFCPDVPPSCSDEDRVVVYSPWEGIKQELSLSDKGDVNFDGPIDVFDQIRIGNHIVGSITFTKSEKWAADVSPVADPSDLTTVCGNNTIDIFDMIGVGNAIVSENPVLSMTARCNI